jgi:epoxyqueuosine reductase
VRPADPPPRPVDDGYVAELRELAAEWGIAHTGVADAAPLTRARTEMHRRRARGLHGEMGFTYRDIDRSTAPSRAVRGARALFAGALEYPGEGPRAPVPAAGRVARYAWDDHTGRLRRGLWAVAHRLRADGYRAVAFADDNSLVDREVAYRAGLGWFGKNANLLVPGAGSFVVLGAVITTAPLPATDAPMADGCGRCTRCVAACPTGAIVAPGVIDARRCLAWVLQRPGSIPVELRAAVGDRVYGCDDCQTACPPTVRLRRQADPPEGAAWVDLVALLEADDEQILARWGRWYIAGRDPRWLRRNALVALGNSDRGDDPMVGGAIHRYAAGDDPLLAEHAAWARNRLAARLAAREVPV